MAASNPIPLMPEAPDNGGIQNVAAEFARLMEEEARALEEQRHLAESAHREAKAAAHEQKEREDNAKDAEERAGRLADEEQRLAEARDRQRRAARELTGGLDIVASAIGAVSDLLRGNFAGALGKISQAVGGAVSHVQGGVNQSAAQRTQQARAAAGPRPGPRPLPRTSGGPLTALPRGGAALPVVSLRGQAAPAGALTAQAAGPGSPLGALSGIAAAAGPVGMALAGVASAANSLKDTLFGLARSASPGVAGALSQSLELLAATVGGIVLPGVVLFGAGVLAVADMIAPMAAKLTNEVTESGGLLRAGMRFFVEWFVGTGLRTIEFGIRSLVAAFLEGSRLLMHASAWVAEKVGLKTMAKKLRAGAAADGRRANRIFNPKESVTSQFTKWAAKNLVGIAAAAGGGTEKTANEGFGKYLREFVDSARILQSGNGGRAQYEAVQESYKRIQMAAVGDTPIQQKIYEIQKKALDWMEKIAQNTGAPPRIPIGHSTVPLLAF
jgi:hypothetical protein